MSMKVGRRLRAGVAAWALLLASAGTVEAGSSGAFDTSEYRANWGLKAINAEEAYGRGLTGAGITVGVIDSAIFAGHPEFAGQITRQAGFLYLDHKVVEATLRRYGYAWPSDSHGTHVAGIIAGRRDGRGMHGVAPNAKLIGADVFSAVPWEFMVDHPDVAASFRERVFDQVFPAAVDYAVANGARIINGSYGSNAWGSHDITPEFQLEYEAYQRAVDKGVILVFAAGNGYASWDPITEHPTLPAMMPFIRPENSGSGLYEEYGGTYDFSGLEGMLVAVVAVDRNNRIASFSNRCGVAQNWCVAAPGVAVRAPIRPGGEDVSGEESASGYADWDGTSMATPHVTGALALMLEAYPGLDPQSIVKILFSTTDDLGAPGVDPIYGHGLINVGRATRGPTTFADTWTMSVAAGGEAFLLNGISGTGGLIKTGDGTLSLAGDNTFSGLTEVRGGVLLVDGRSVSPITVQAGGTIGGRGLLAAPLTVRGTLSPGASPGVLTVAAPVVLAAGATTRMELDGRRAGNGAGFYDQLRVTGAGNTFTAAGRLVPVVRGITGEATNSYDPIVGDRFTIVLAEGGVVGTFDRVVQPTEGFAGRRMDIRYGADSIGLIVTPLRYAALGAAGLHESTTTRRVGAVLDGLRPGVGDDPGPLFEPLYALRGNAVSSALDLASGAVHAEVGRGQTLLRRAVTRTTLERAAAPLGAPAGDGAATVAGHRGQVWATALGGWNRVETNHAGPGVTANTFGFQGGADRLVGEGARIGVTVAFGRADMQQMDTPASADVDSWQAGVYGTWGIGATSVTATVSGGVDRAEVDRPLGPLAASDATSSAKGAGVAAGIEVAHRLVHEDGTHLRPFVGLMGESTWRNHRDERGGDAWRLDVRDGSSHRMTAQAGIGASRATDIAGLAVVPAMSLGLSYDVVQEDNEAGVTLLGQRITAEAARPGRLGMSLGLGVTTEASAGVTVGLSYALDARADAQAHTARASVGVRW